MAPDYREAACCLHCHYLASTVLRCIKHSQKVDLACVCADFATTKDVEGEVI